jgi:hypothetical protein
LIALKYDLPAPLRSGAEKAIGVAIALLAGRVIWKWVRGDYRAGSHRHDTIGGISRKTTHRHPRRDGGHGHDRDRLRTPRQALALGILHGLAGTGAVVILLIAALPSQLEAAAALAVFAPMTLVSMAALTGAFAWLLTRRLVQPVYRGVLIPALGVFGLVFGSWYAGIT